MDKEIIRNIVKEAMYDMFGNDITASEKKKEQTKKNKERAHKAAQTRKTNKGKKDKEYEKNFMTARSHGDLFNGEPSKEERSKAEKYIQDNRKDKKKTNESKLDNIISSVIQEQLHR